MNSPVVVFFAAVLSGAVLTAVLYYFLARHDVMDLPSARSLHQRAVPRGGGVSIVLVVLLGSFVFLGDELSRPMFAAMLAGATLMGIVGLIDDVRGLANRVRFFGQCLVSVAFCTLLFVATMNEAGLFGRYTPQVILIVGPVLLVWVINLFNFMDGADGFAATETITVLVAAGLFHAFHGSIHDAIFPVLVAGAAAGFLLWNWQPAKIFMGDAGSYFLGFIFGALVLMAFGGSRVPFLLPVLLSPFIVDASFTLIRRIVSGERWWEAHRTHLYQRLILTGSTHRKVCIALAVYTVVVLAPLAFVSDGQGVNAVVAALFAYLLTAIIWVFTHHRINQRKT